MSASVSSPASTPTPSESANNGDAALRFSVHLGLVCTSFLAVVLLLLGRRRHDYRRKPFSAGKSDRNKAGYAPVGLHDVEDQSCRPNAASGPEEQLPPIDLAEAAPTSPDAEPSPASFGAQQKSLRAAYRAQQLRNQKFSRVKRDYLAAYLLAMYADWLQGPYVYALYDAYGFSKQQNGVLFICGFGSSALLGTVIAGYADKFGRKRFCILYCFVYVFSCFTKHVNWFYVLCFGRLLAGVATSLLFSVFESWVVCAVTQLDVGREDERANREEDDADRGELQQQESSRVQEQLSDLFSTAIFGNSLCAIFAGFSAQWVSEGGGEFRRVFDAVVVWGASGVGVLAGTAAEEGGGRGQRTSAARSFGNMLANDASVYVGKFLGPFDLAACVLVLCALFIYARWSENFGEEQGSHAVDVGVDNAEAAQQVGGKPLQRGDAEVENTPTSASSKPRIKSAARDLSLRIDAVHPAEAANDRKLVSFGSEEDHVASPASANMILAPSEVVMSPLGIPLPPIEIDSSGAEDHGEIMVTTRNAGRSKNTVTPSAARSKITATPSASAHRSSSQNEISRAWRVLKTCPDVQKLGWTCALFESSMFIFVFLWTPALHEIAPTASKPPYGLIFALFMLACMCGSLLFSLLQSSKTEKELAGILLSVAIVSNAVVVCTNNTFLLLLGFLGFELSLGLYFPVFGLLKSRLVPERSRAMLYNFFRVPLNLIVVGSLAVDIPVRLGFLLITGMLLLCAVLLRFSDYETNSANRREQALPGELEFELVDGDRTIVLDKDYKHNQQGSGNRSAEFLPAAAGSVAPDGPANEAGRANEAGLRRGGGGAGDNASRLRLPSDATNFSSEDEGLEEDVVVPDFHTTASLLQKTSARMIKELAFGTSSPEPVGEPAAGVGEEVRASTGVDRTKEHQIRTRSYAHGVLSMGRPAPTVATTTGGGGAVTAASSSSSTAPGNKGAHKTETSDGSDDDDGNPTDFLVFGGYSPRNSGANRASQNQEQNDAEKSDTSARRAPQLVGVATAARPGAAAQKAGSASASLFGSRTRADGAAQKARLEQYLRALEADSSDTDADGGI